ncbi:glycosyltransferase family 2 protein [Pedobacter sp. UC225_65]|uniref:glycosyltransferase family 2 protein n=1 Tax=Pedobacter sp. UC225_65 TaxID=3350173 RepID=UPI003671674C
MQKKVLIVIPCYNEEVALPLLLQELKQLELPEEYALTTLVVNDCSKDKTVEVARNHHTKVLDLPNNLGIGGAVQSGFKYAKINDFDMAIQLDGDGQHPPCEIIKLLNANAEFGADVVIGSRFLANEGFQSSFMRRMGIKYFYRLNQLLTGNNIYDSTSGFRLLGRKAITIAAENYPDDYPEPESLVIFSRARLKIKEVPVVMSHRLGGTSSIGNFSSVYYCIKVTISMLFSFIRKPQ